MTSATEEISPTGPRRKRYSLAKSVTITMDLAPNLFIERGVAFKPRMAKEKGSQGAVRLRERVREATEGKDDREKLSVLSGVLNEVDERIRHMEDDRVELLRVRNEAMREAA